MDGWVSGLIGRGEKGSGREMDRQDRTVHSTQFRTGRTDRQAGGRVGGDG